MQLVRLEQQDEQEQRTSGVACVVDNGSSKQFVVYLFGASPTGGEQAYQVWLIRNGERTSAGTFRGAESDGGVGLLAMPLKKLDRRNA